MTRWMKLPKLERDPDGHPLCRWCKKRVPKGRSAWCSQACVDEYLVRSNGNVMRSMVEARDGGRCARCGFEAEDWSEMERELRASNGSDWWWSQYTPTGALNPILGGRWEPTFPQRWRDLGEWFWSERKRFHQEVKRWLLERGYRTDITNWEAHHKHAVSEGGGACGLDGYETLCRRCHAKESGMLRHRLSAKAAEYRTQKEK
jgi:hypothetical protein